LRSHIVFKSSGDNFIVAGEKGDFLIGSNPKLNVEIYDKTTGRYLGSEVLETLPTVTYESVWYPMWSVNGWTSIKFEEDNADAKDFPQVYFNGSATVFDVHYNEILGVKTSRKYDIELKKSYVFLNDEGDELRKVEFLYPAFFIQANEITTLKPFGTANEKNSNLFSHSITSQQQTNVRAFYGEMKTAQQEYKATDVDAYITTFLSNLGN